MLVSIFCDAWTIYNRKQRKSISYHISPRTLIIEEKLSSISPSCHPPVQDIYMSIPTDIYRPGLYVCIFYCCTILNLCFIWECVIRLKFYERGVLIKIFSGLENVLLNNYNGIIYVFSFQNFNYNGWIVINKYEQVKTVM